MDTAGSGARSSYEDVLGLSREMYTAAQGGEWALLAELEARRRPLVEQVFGARPVGQAAAMADAIRSILELDRETMALAEAGRKEAGDALHQIATGRRAQHAYGDAAP